MQHMSTRTHIGPPTSGDALAGVYAAIIVTSGVYGLINPSISIESGLQVATVIYSLGLITMGTVAGVSVAWQWRRTELAALLTLAALTALHSVLVAVSSGASGGQTALRLGAAVVGLSAWALCRWDRGITRREVDRHIHNALGDPPHAR